MSTITERLQEIIKTRKLIPSNVAKEAGISKTSMSEYLLGKCEPKRINLRKLAKYFNVSELWLMGQDVPMQFDTIEIKNKSHIKIPIIKKITYKEPILASKNIKDYEYVATEKLSFNKEYFFIEAFDNSLDLKFHKVDKILVQQQDNLKNNDIGLIMINEELFIRHYKEENKIIILEPISSNTKDETKIYNVNDNKLTIIGKVVYIIYSL